MDEYKNKIIQADCREELQKLPDEYADVVVTSPPYWGLRDYGNEDQIGTEPLYEDYVDAVADVADEIMRVLSERGVFWLVVDDSYSTDAGYQVSETKNPNTDIPEDQPNRNAPLGHKCKMLIPHRIAIEMIERGWIHRQDVVWRKTNAKPESVTDRFVDDYEYVFQFVKNEQYYFNSDAAVEEAKDGGERNRRSVVETKIPSGGWSCTAVFSEELVEILLESSMPEDGVVLDPFGGAGTVAVVADRLGYQWTLIELNEQYVTEARDRVNSTLSAYSR